MQELIEFTVRMKTKSGEVHEFIYKGRSATRFAYYPWIKPGTQIPDTAAVNEKLRENGKFKKGSRVDVIVHGRFHELEGITVLGSPAIHVVNFRPAGDPNWPVKPIDPPPSDTLEKSMSEIYDLDTLNLQQTPGLTMRPTSQKPAGLPNDENTTCATNAVLQCLSWCRGLIPWVPPERARDNALALQLLPILQQLTTRKTPAYAEVKELHKLIKTLVLPADMQDTFEDARNVLSQILTNLEPSQSGVVKRTKGPCPKCKANVFGPKEVHYQV